MYHSLFFFLVTIWLKICIPKSTNFICRTSGVTLPNAIWNTGPCSWDSWEFHPLEVTKHVCRSRNIYLPPTISITCPTFYIQCIPSLNYFHHMSHCLHSSLSHATFPIYRIAHLAVSNTIHQRTISSLPQTRWHITMKHILVHLSQQQLWCRFPLSLTFPFGLFWTSCPPPGSTVTAGTLHLDSYAT